MVEIYVTLILSKRRTFEQVPDGFKQAVKKRLSDLGFHTDGSAL